MQVKKEKKVFAFCMWHNFVHDKNLLLTTHVAVWLVQEKTPVPNWSLKFSCWVGLISRWATILVALWCLPGEVALALYFTLVPPTSVFVCGLSFSQSKPDLRVFLLVLWFSSLSKTTPSQKYLTWVLCSRIISKHLVAATEAPFTCIRPILLSYMPFAIQPPGWKWGWLADTIII